jgi:hypothetical protein
MNDARSSASIAISSISSLMATERIAPFLPRSLSEMFATGIRGFFE